MDWLGPRRYGKEARLKLSPGVKCGVAGVAESERNGFQSSVSDDLPRPRGVEDDLEELRP